VDDRVVKVAGPAWREALPWGVPREIEVMQRGLVHPNIAPFVEHGSLDDGRPWLAMAYVKGTPLRTLLIGDDPPDVRAAVGITRAIGEALAAAHAVGVLHSDVNIQNVIVPPRADGATLVDWGIAALVDPDGDRTTTARFKSGTPRYAAPEQRTPGFHSPATDVWGLGTLLFCMLYGTTPFGRSDLARDTLAIPPGHPDLEKAISVALAPRPADRCALAELLGMLGG